LIRLADGHEWGFAAQTRRLFPSVVESVDSLGRRTESIAVRPGFGYPLEIKRQLDDFRTACGEESIEEQYQAFFSLAITLLCSVHEIDRSTACILLTVDDTDLPRLITEVLSIAFDTHPGPTSIPEEGQTDG
jgi:hypothetical protein